MDIWLYIDRLIIQKIRKEINGFDEKAI
jgi:hypothetical protein